MTTINTIEDLIRLLDEHPEWAEALRARLLTRELLEVPETLARFIEAANARFDRLESDVAVLKEDVAVLKEDVAVLKEDVGVLKEDVGVLKSHSGFLRGIALERSLERRIMPFAGQRFRLRRAEIVVGALQGIQLDFRDTIEDRLDSAQITAAQKDRLFFTDFILRGIRQDTRDPLWVAVEASSKVRERDIERAVETANIINRTFDEEVAPVVAGFDIDPEDLQRANEAGVVYLEVPEE